MSPKRGKRLIINTHSDIKANIPIPPQTYDPSFNKNKAKKKLNENNSNDEKNGSKNMKSLKSFQNNQNINKTMDNIKKSKLLKYKRIKQLIQKVKCMCVLTPKQLDRCIEYCKEIKFKKNDRIFRQGECDDKMIVLVQGNIKKNINNKTKQLYIGQGLAMGEINLISDVPSPCDYVADSNNVVCYYINRHEYCIALENINI